MATTNGAPVPVPKASLFKTTMDPAKAKVKTQKVTVTASTQPAGFTAFNDAHEAAPVGNVIPVSPVPPPVGVPGVPLIKAKAAVIQVAIPFGLAESILSKPSTGGGWQAIMGELQKALNGIDQGIDMIDAPGMTHVLNLTPALLNKLVDKATMYGPGGGYQGVMKSIVCLAVKQHPGQILSGKGGQ